MHQQFWQVHTFRQRHFSEDSIIPRSDDYVIGLAIDPHRTHFLMVLFDYENFCAQF